MDFSRSVRVHYPTRGGRIILRTEQDWNLDIEPETSDPDGTVFEFTLRSPRPFLYYKPCLVEAGRTHWSEGTNYLVMLTLSESRDIYPHFRTGPEGSISPLIELESDHLSRRHRLRVYLPPGYSENTLKRYPVLYMQDGKNLFFPDEAFLGREWKVLQTMNLLNLMSVIDRMIVVGIHSGDREMEYTRPGYKRYGLSLVEEVKPMMDSTFRTLPGPGHTTAMGSSLGGVVSFYLAWEWPGVFGRAACMSGTFGWKDDLVSRVCSEPRREIRVYLDSGWPGDNYEVTLGLTTALIERGYVFGRDFIYFVFPLARHDETFWSARAHLPLQFFNGMIPRASLLHEDSSHEPCAGRPGEDAPAGREESSEGSGKAS